VDSKRGVIHNVAAEGEKRKTTAKTKGGFDVLLTKSARRNPFGEDNSICCVVCTETDINSLAFEEYLPGYAWGSS
jgi:hypothetical protein